MNSSSNTSNTLFLKQSNLLLRNTGPAKALLWQPKFWHKFIVIDGAALSPQSVLKTIVNDVQDIFPVQYTIEGNNATFIAHNCGSAVEYLCQKNLIVDYCDGKQLKLNIVLNGGIPNMATYKIQDWLFEILQARYDKANKCLDLDNLENDPKLLNQLYCSLENPKIFTFILSLVRNFDIRLLLLSNNGIKNISALEIFWTSRKITSIDLTNNQIEYTTDLEPLQNLPITSLWLEGNPICQYHDESSYVINIKKICPKIEKLDGVTVATKGLPCNKKNFFINLNGKEFVEQFLEHYFTLYDSNYRKNLKMLYHNNAVFSITFSFLPGQNTSKDSQFGIYQYKCRNLLTLCDISKCAENLIIGPQQIINFFALLPKTEHNKLSFTVDLLHFSEYAVVILVTGIFKEVDQNRGRVQYLNFTRTFILTPVGNGEYQISNEQLHVSNARNDQVEKLKKMNNSFTPIYTNDEKSEIVETFARITTTNMQTAQKYLLQNKWDLKRALTNFLSSYKNNEIPPEAFTL